MSERGRRSLATTCLLAAAAGWAGCGGEDGEPPAIAIATPHEGDVVPLGDDADKSVPLMLKIDYFRIGDPELRACGEDGHCGHIHVNVDGDACNAPGGVANDEPLSVRAAAKLALCPKGMEKGNHTVRVGLYDDNHAPVKRDGADVAAEVTITVE